MKNIAVIGYGALGKILNRALVENSDHLTT